MGCKSCKILPSQERKQETIAKENSVVISLKESAQINEEASIEQDYKRTIQKLLLEQEVKRLELEKAALTALMTKQALDIILLQRLLSKKKQNVV